MGTRDYRLPDTGRWAPRLGLRPPAPVVVLAATGTALIAVAFGGSAGSMSRLGQLTFGLGGAAVLFLAGTWWIARLVTWRDPGGPWWQGLDHDGQDLGGTRAAIHRCGAAGEAWARAGFRTARRLHADNAKVCRRADRTALARSRRWDGGELDPDDPDNPIGPMWASLAEGRARLAELCCELRGLSGRHAATAPPAEPVPGPGPIEDLGAVAERLQALNLARCELAGTAARAADRSGRQSSWPDLEAQIAGLIEQKAPDVSGEFARAWQAATTALSACAAGVNRLEAAMATFPEEAPAEYRRLHHDTRRARVAELRAYEREVRVAAGDVLAAAVELLPPPPPARRRPAEVERAAVAEAEGMITVLREAGSDRRPLLAALSDPAAPDAADAERFPPDTSDPPPGG